MKTTIFVKTICLLLLASLYSAKLYCQQPLRANTMPSWSNNPEEGNAQVGQPLIVWGSAFGGTPPYTFDLTVDNIAVTNNDPFPVTNSTCYAYKHYIGNNYTFTTCGIHVVCLKVTDAAGAVDVSISKVYAWSNPTDSVRTDMVIDKGLLYLYKNAMDYGTNKIYWPGGGGDDYDYAATASSILAFEERNHLPVADFKLDPYAELVSLGLNYVVSEFSGQQSISNHDDGNGIKVSDLFTAGPGNGKGSFLFGDLVYANSFGLLAVILSQPDAATAAANVINSGPFNGWSYYNLIQDCLDLLYWDQGDDYLAGGWHYNVLSQQTDDYEGSTQQWPCLVMKAAEDRWGIQAPAWVKQNSLVAYAALTTATGGCEYMVGMGDDAGKTGGKLAAYAWTNKFFGPDADANLAVSYIGTTYNRENLFYYMGMDGAGWAGSLYHMYALKKGLKLQNIITVNTPNGVVDWYKDMVAWLTGEQIYTLPNGFTTSFKNLQNCYGQYPDGSWLDAVCITDKNLGTAHALLILIPYLFVPAPPAVVANYNICKGDTIQITALVNNPTYSWLPATNISNASIKNPYVYPEETTDYFVTYTDSAGCTAVEDHIVHVNAINVIPSLINTECAGDADGAVSLTVFGGSPWITGYDYNWSNSSSTKDLINLVPGTYTVTITDSISCTTTSSFTIVQLSPPVTASFSSNPMSGIMPLPVDFTNTSSGGYSYNWTFGDGSYSSEENPPQHLFEDQGLYTVTLVVFGDTQYMCTDTFSLIINVENPSLINVPNVFTPNSDGKNDEFFIENKQIIQFACGIYNRWGKKIYEWYDISQGWDGKTLDGREASEGTYYFILKAKGIDNVEYEQHGAVTLLR